MVRKTFRTSELLESLMAGHQMTPSELEDLIKIPVTEDLFLEYKHGKLLTRKDAAQSVREYLSGFANSAGGILVIGVDEATWSITDCTAPGGENLAEWASRCLAPIAPYFSPLPRFQVVKHSDGDVLIASTDRSLSLVPCVQAGELVYFLRFHDQTLKAPEYLVSDILLGRRQRPHFHIRDFDLAECEPRQEPQSGAYDLYFSPAFVCENHSLFRSDFVRLGIISWVKHPLGGNILSNHLLSYVEIRDLDKGWYSGSSVLVHTERLFPGIGPFDVGVFNTIETHVIPLRLNNRWYTPYTWRAAAYLMTDEAPPVWYQLSMEVNNGMLGRARANVPLASYGDLLEVKRVHGERPVVEWENK